ncbi:hypothetical protein CDAR_168401 [Caerostris darwini]|uniref:Uncharacterized protein n=1 Tax=Caerostris darwini TaxID=1538125 RepID=A0AAV4T6B3_9ARAC|nr:hypothetical protein CDAR_168401 [Caerostris darwini]
MSKSTSDVFKAIPFQGTTSPNDVTLKNCSFRIVCIKTILKRTNAYACSNGWDLEVIRTPPSNCPWGFDGLEKILFLFFHNLLCIFGKASITLSC